MIDNKFLGIDIGGSGIKGAVVDCSTGELTTERFRIPTPFPSKPKAVAKAFGEIVNHFNWSKEIGVGFPTIIDQGIAKSAANVDKKWIGTDVQKLFSQTTGCPVFVNNDADIAGIAEMNFGAGQGHDGVVLLITIGTGLGSALFYKGVLIPNTELGHLNFKGMLAEHYAADSARKKNDLSWEKWGKRFNEYLNHLERLFTPNLIILGGGASKKMEKYRAQLDTTCAVVPAQLLNNAGIIGAASLAASKVQATRNQNILG